MFGLPNIQQIIDDSEKRLSEVEKKIDQILNDLKKVLELINTYFEVRNERDNNSSS